MEMTYQPLMHQVMERAARNLVPLQVAIEVTHRCNLRCTHCYADVHEEQLDFFEIKNILDQLAAAGTMYLLLTGGEALMREDFIDIASYARKTGFIFSLITNGTLITPEIADMIRETDPLDVGISLYGADAVTHESVTRVKGSFESTIRGITLLKERGVSITIQTTVLDLNVDQVPALKKLAGELGVKSSYKYDLVPARSGSLLPFEHAVNPRDLTIEDLSSDQTEKKRCIEICKAGRGMCAITANGNVFPCIVMPMNIGNLRERSFEDIWRTNPSTDLKELRKLTTNDLKKCLNCELSQYCSICLGSNYVETGKLTDPAPSACRNAALKSNNLQRKGVGE